MTYKDKTLIVYLPGDYRRFKKVYNLYQKFQASNSLILMMSFNDKSKLRGNNSILKPEYNISQENILTEYYSTSTYTEAVELQKILAEHTFFKIIVVTSIYHIPRTRYIFGKVIKNKIFYVPSFHKFSFKVILNEIIKFFLFIFRSYKVFTKNETLYSQNIYRLKSRFSKP